MAILRRQKDKLDIHLPVDALVGRGDAFDVQLVDRSTSRPHAIFHWAEGKWTLRDLGSANGTYVGTELLALNESKVLRRGVTIRFGCDQETFQLTNTSGPTPLARHLGSGRTIEMQDGMLQLPDDKEPIATIAEAREAEQLRIDMAPRLGRVIDREVIDVAGELWQLRTATTPSSSTSHSQIPLCVATMSIRFNANPAWTAIPLDLKDGPRHTSVKHYAHHELLLVLANERVNDADSGKKSEECGWLSVAEVAGRLATNEAIVNSLVHKVRSRFRALDVVPAADIVERRPGQMRLGIEHIELNEAARSKNR